MANRTCPSCSTEFAAVGRQIYCTKRCMKTANRDGKAECSHADCVRMVRAKGLCVTHYNKVHHPDSRELWPADPEKRRRLLRTKTQRRRALVKDPGADKVDRDVVGDRDHWKCGVCRKRVDNSIPYPQPTSPSLDHVIPLSQGGSHTYANCRITHLGCNLQRSNKGGNEQLMLIG